MTFTEAVRICLTQKYVSFSGRARRSEYWWFVLFNLIVTGVAAAIDTLAGTSSSSGTGVFGAIAALALLLPGLGVQVRRLHDTGRSAWNLAWLLLCILPGQIVLMVFAAQDSKPGPNQYGENPKGDVGAGLG